MNNKYKIGSVWVTRGGWMAVVCDCFTVFHHGKAPGSQLRSFDMLTGKVSSGEVGSAHDLLYEVIVE